MTLNANKMIELTADHVDWFSEILKPLLRSWMEHGYKHGWDDGVEEGFRKGKLSFLRENKTEGQV